MGYRRIADLSLFGGGRISVHGVTLRQILVASKNGAGRPDLGRAVSRAISHFRGMSWSADNSPPPRLGREKARPGGAARLVCPTKSREPCQPMHGVGWCKKSVHD